MKKAGLKKIYFFKLLLICVISLSACARTEENENAMQKMEQSSTPPPSSEKPKQAESEDTEPESTEPEDISSTQIQWEVNICPDIPQPYIEVLKQYEEFMNADNQNLNDDSVRTKFWGGEWKYLYDELCGAWTSAIERETAENAESILRYALADLTGDGFPEMIIAYKDIPEVIYNYSETNGIGMECATSYYAMTIYENGIVEYVSGGMYCSTTYLQFKEDVDGWVVLDSIAVWDTWDAVNKKMNDTEYYTGEWGGDGMLDEKISEEQYRQIQEKYVTEPMKFEWIPLVYNSAKLEK